MRFTKMHGIGNDYVYVNCFTETVEDPAKTAVTVSDRHFGIGSDGLILIKPSKRADFEMEMYNADGSVSPMCGNGIRCVAKYVYDHGMTDQTTLTIGTGSGIKTLTLSLREGKVSSVTVDMGAPILEAQEIPVIAEKSPVVDEEILVEGTPYRMTCVSMGNPHCIVRVEDVDSLDLSSIGPLFEHHARFPKRINTEFIRVLDSRTVQMRVWERGTGETLACGTGACAVTVAGILNGWLEDEALIRLRGGDLRIRWDREKDTVFMTGPAVTVFEGEIAL